ncbi:MAG TPA: glycoside hydrolase family 31 protein [bacterium]|nr:glycoside hydrolase family 31 protein [bacterium]
MKRLILVFCSVLVLFPSTLFSSEKSFGSFTVSTNEKSISIKHEDRSLFEILDIGAEKFDVGSSMKFGFHKLKKKNVEKVDVSFDKREFPMGIFNGNTSVGSLDFEVTGNGNLRGIIRIDNDLDIRSLKLIFSAGAGDRFWGFGEQYNYVDFRGMEVPVWVSEQGVGRMKKPKMPYHGTFTDTYFPMPYFIDPGQGKGFLLENTQYSSFTLMPKGREFWMVEVWDTHELSFLLLPGPKPADVVEQLTAEVGRPSRIPPDWSMSGVWLAAQGGMEKVWDRYEKAVAAGFPLSAMWVQDWVGNRHFGAGNYGVNYRWVHDDEFYEDLKLKIKKMNENGVRFLGYFNPFVIPENLHFQPCAENGYLVKNEAGEPYVFQIITFKGGIIDVFNPDAVEYFKSYARKGIELGLSGWMADFGEWMPYDSVSYAGSGKSLHNVYATEWHKVNRDVLEEMYPDGDYVMLTRSGYTNEHKVVQFYWPGDQEANWEESDGLPTVVNAGLTIGLAGIPFFTFDIAGFSGGPSTRELFMRWTELGAFAPVMRTHDGLQKLKNHKFDSDEETLKHFSKFAFVHKALLPYFRELAGEAVEKGLPVIRHTVIVDPDWDRSYEAHGQWMIGNDIAFAPVVDKGAVSVEISLPEGEWEHLLTGERVSGRKTVQVEAPVGTPAVFIRRETHGEMVKEIRKIFNSH